LKSPLEGTKQEHLQKSRISRISWHLLSQLAHYFQAIDPDQEPDSALNDAKSCKALLLKQDATKCSTKVLRGTRTYNWASLAGEGKKKDLSGPCTLSTLYVFGVIFGALFGYDNMERTSREIKNNLRGSQRGVPTVTDQFRCMYRIGK
jgi:hypothetical protein